MADGEHGNTTEEENPTLEKQLKQRLTNMCTDAVLQVKATQRPDTLR